MKEVSTPPIKRPPSIIAVDFDGTCVTHEFPKVGRDIGAVSVLYELVRAGHHLILYTMRSDHDTYVTPLTDAVNWFASHSIPLLGVNHNAEQSRWTSSPKVYAHLYIDDAALGIPLKQGLKGERPFVDWTACRQLLVELGYL